MDSFWKGCRIPAFYGGRNRFSGHTRDQVWQRTVDRAGVRERTPRVSEEGGAILKLLAGEDQAPLVREDALLVPDLGLDVVDGVGGLDLEGDGPL